MMDNAGKWNLYLVSSTVAISIVGWTINEQGWLLAWKDGRNEPSVYSPMAVLKIEGIEKRTL